MDLIKVPILSSTSRLDQERDAGNGGLALYTPHTAHSYTASVHRVCVQGNAKSLKIWTNFQLLLNWMNRWQSAALDSVTVTSIGLFILYIFQINNNLKQDQMKNSLAVKLSC